MSTVITEPSVDVCVLGLGVTGGIVATELALAGHSVVGIEKGPYWDFLEDFSSTKYDEWGVAMMHKYDHPLWLSTFTWRNNGNQFAIPARKYTSGTAPLGHGVGGGMHHWGAGLGRYSPWSYTPYSSTVSKYGPSFLSNIEPNLDLIDFPVTYADMVPYYEQFEQAWGVTGTNQNPFIPMSSNFPLPPHPITPVGTVFQTATEALGYTPFPVPSGIASKPYVNQYGLSINACVYDGWCEAQCETGAKSTTANNTIPAAIKTGKFTMALDSYVFRLDANSSGKITDARYYDAMGNVHVQPATAFFVGLWGINNSGLSLKSGVGGTPYNFTTATGTMGRGAMPNFGTASTASVSGALNIGANAYPAGNASGAWEILDWADDNFDHTGLSFIGGNVVSVGGYVGSGPGNLPIAGKFSAANIGSAYKASVKNSNLKTSTTVSLSITNSQLPQTTQGFDLDPHYVDIYGDPITRITTDNPDANVYNMNKYITPLLAPILTKMGASNVTQHAGPASLAAAGHCLGFGGAYHIKSGTRMGASSTNSALNMYQQCWTNSNLFITGESALPWSNKITAGTHAMAPHAYVAAEGIQKYLTSPGELVTSM